MKRLEEVLFGFGRNYYKDIRLEVLFQPYSPQQSGYDTHLMCTAKMKSNGYLNLTTKHIWIVFHVLLEAQARLKLSRNSSLE